MLFHEGASIINELSWRIAAPIAKKHHRGYIIWDFVQVSAAPKHIALQLIELACSEHCIEAVLDDLSPHRCLSQRTCSI